MVSACRAIGQRLSKGGHSRRHLGGAHSYTLPLTTCWQRRHEGQLLLGAYNSWGEAATPFKQTKRTHNRQVIQMSVWWAPGKSVLNRRCTYNVLDAVLGPRYSHTIVIINKEGPSAPSVSYRNGHPGRWGVLLWVVHNRTPISPPHNPAPPHNTPRASFAPHTHLPFL